MRWVLMERCVVDGTRGVRVSLGKHPRGGLFAPCCSSSLALPLALSLAPAMPLAAHQGESASATQPATSGLERHSKRSLLLPVLRRMPRSAKPVLAGTGQALRYVLETKPKRS